MDKCHPLLSSETPIVAGGRTMVRLSLSLLGPFQAALDGEPITAFESNRVRALLAYLAVEADRPHRRDTLAGLLWPDWPDRSARANLRNALANLRKCIRDHEAALPHLLITRETIQFNRAGDHWLDVTAFRAAVEAEGAGAAKLEEALALYRGPFLEGFAVEDSAAYEDWAQRVREELERLALNALERLATAYEERGEFGQAIDAARRQVDLATWQESAHRQLMRLLALDGQRSAALAQYEACRRLLREELDVEPSAETTRLYECIRYGQDLSGFPQPDRSAGNLPAQPTPFVGRERTLAEIEERLRDPGCRLLALVGLGGSGKTRLALEAAARQIGRYSDGVFFVALASLQSVEAIVPTVAQAIGFTFYSGVESKEQLLNYLRSKNVLLVLDNFEHLVEGVGIVADILRAAPQVKVLATSRSGLHVQGEHRFPVGGMDYPSLTPGPSPVYRRGELAGDALEYSAVRLFVEGARRARPDFALTDDNAADVVRICGLVEGMPLALLLAAAWIEMLTPAEVAAEIERSLDFLETDLRDAPDRQRSLRAVFDHSWSLLPEGQQGVMQALSVFRGGFTREAAQEVAGASLRDLISLVNRSMLHRAPQGRYDVHELLRQYAAEKLDQAPDAGKEVRDRHCAYYAAVLQQWGEDLKGPRQMMALAEMDVEIDNARAAWDWAADRSRADQSRAKRGHVDHLAQGIEGLVHFYDWRVRYQEGESAFGRVADRLAESTESPPDVVCPPDVVYPLRAQVLNWQSHFCYRLGDAERARGLLEQSLDLLDSVASADTRRERAFALLRVAWIESLSGDRARARAPYEQSLALYRALGDRWYTALTLHGLGVVVQALGEYDRARQLHQEALEIYRALGDQRGIVIALSQVAHVSSSQGQFGEAERLHREGLMIARQMDDPALICQGLWYLSLTLTWKGEFAECQLLLEESLAIGGDLGGGVFFVYHYSLMWMGLVRVLQGQYKGARVYLSQGLIFNQESSDSWGTGIGFRSLGLVALAEGQYAEAQGWLEQSVAVLRIATPSDVGWSLSALAGAARGLGQMSQAREHLREALRISAEIRDAFTPMQALPIAALLLADEGEVERAVEIYALASRYGFVGNSRLWEDIAGKHIVTFAATLPPEVVAAAQARGRARDLEATVVELLEYLI
jgi:predicted ATPase/DNA-binding SARP family transcriptional activator